MSTKKNKADWSSKCCSGISQPLFALWFAVDAVWRYWWIRVGSLSAEGKIRRVRNCETGKFKVGVGKNKVGKREGYFTNECWEHGSCTSFQYLDLDRCFSMHELCERMMDLMVSTVFYGAATLCEYEGEGTKQTYRLLNWSVTDYVPTDQDGQSDPKKWGKEQVTIYKSEMWGNRGKIELCSIIHRPTKEKTLQQQLPVLFLQTLLYTFLVSVSPGIRKFLQKVVLKFRKS